VPRRFFWSDRVQETPVLRRRQQAPELHIRCFQQQAAPVSLPAAKMMDPGQQPSTDDVRDSSTRPREATKRQERRPRALQSADGIRRTGTRDEELLEAREELRLAKEELLRYRELFDFAPDAYVITDIYGNICEANLAAGKMLGVDAKRLGGKPLPSFFDESGRRKYRQQLDHICDFDRLDDWELVLQPRSGDPVPVSVSIGRNSRQDNGAGGYRWILRDITKRVRTEDALRELNRELEIRVSSRTAQLASANLAKDALLFSERKARDEAETANRVKADFLALLSHESRTPLQAIFGYIELLERQIHGPLTEAQLADLRRIKQSQQHLLGLIKTIVDFASVDAGQRPDIHLCPTPLHEILRDMEGFIGSQVEKRALSYDYHCSDEQLIAYADPAKVQQIVLNLLANALKFTPSGGHISLDCGRDGSSVAIRVSDSGVGIPGEKLEEVFAPLTQIQNNDGATHGTGLGLSISRRLAAEMGGTLTASSDAGRGSTFILRLPLAKA
jgi:PAS domain S-box-containing protein